MSDNRKKLGFEVLLDKFKSNFGRLILTNLIFALPFGIALCGVYLLDHFLVHIAPLTLPLVFVLVSPFYPGVVVLTRNFSTGKYDKGIFKTYLRAVKENWYKFLLCGVLLYIACVGGYFSISGYIAFASGISWMFYILLFFSVLICLFLLFMFFCLVLMIPSFELKLKDAFKNSALSVFGEFKECLLSLLSIIVYLAVVLMPIIVFFNLAGTLTVELVKILLVSYTVLVLLVLIPAPCQFLICHCIYPKMFEAVAGEKKAKTEESQNREIQSVSIDATDKPDGLEELLEGDDEEYIFYNGKMIKRGLLKKLLKQEQKEDKNE